MPPKIVYRRPIVGKFGVLQVFDTNDDPAHFQTFQVDDGIEKDGELLIGNPFLYVEIDDTATFYTVKNKKDKIYVAINGGGVRLEDAMKNGKILTPGCIFKKNYIFTEFKARGFHVHELTTNKGKILPTASNYNYYVDEDFELEKIVENSLINSLKY